MSTEAVRELLGRAAHDGRFAALLESDREAALAEQGQRLTAQERAWLASAPKDVLPALSRTVPEELKDSGRATRLSVKELGALLLTAVLVLVFVAVIVQTLRTVNEDPRGVQVGDTTQLVSPFANAKDLLGVVLPLFGAAVTFWLGAAVEGRRADANGKAAEQAAEERDLAKRQANDTRTTAAEALGLVEGALRASGGTTSTTPEETASTVERRTAGAPRAPESGDGQGRGGVDVGGLMNIVAQARNDILRSAR